MCYAENGTVKFLETLADNVFTHNYSMMEIKKKMNYGKILGFGIFCFHLIDKTF
jgi:hypothetical protein